MEKSCFVVNRVGCVMFMKAEKANEIERKLREIENTLPYLMR